jgi:hypothetical protein
MLAMGLSLTIPIILVSISNRRLQRAETPTRNQPLRSLQWKA